MGSNSSSGGGGGVGAAGRKTDGSYGTKKDAEQTRLENFQRGTINRTKEAVAKAPVIAAKVLSPLAVLGADINSKFFTDKVLTSSKAKKNIGYTQSEFAALTAEQQNKVYSDYMSARQSGTRDAYGNLMPGVSIENVAYRKADGTMTTREVVMRDNGGAMGTSGQIVQAPTAPSPTTAEVSQVTATDVTEDNLTLRKRRALARGRSPTIMTGVTGATGSLTLGKPSLLGR